MSLHLYVEDVDARYRQALSEGATERRPVEDRFYGDLSGVLEDPFGRGWSLSTRKEDLSHEEIRRRARELFQKTPSCVKSGGRLKTTGDGSVTESCT